MKVNEENFTSSLLDRLYEGVLDMPDGTDPDSQLDILIQRMLIARKMLGMTNKLSRPEDRRKHRSRVMGLLNQIRGGIARIEKQIVSAENNSIK